MLLRPHFSLICTQAATTACRALTQACELPWRGAWVVVRLRLPASRPTICRWQMEVQAPPATAEL